MANPTATLAHTIHTPRDTTPHSSTPARAHNTRARLSSLPRSFPVYLFLPSPSCVDCCLAALVHSLPTDKTRTPPHTRLLAVPRLLSCFPACLPCSSPVHLARSFLSGGGFFLMPSKPAVGRSFLAELPCPSHARSCFSNFFQLPHHRARPPAHTAVFSTRHKGVGIGK